MDQKSRPALKRVKTAPLVTSRQRRCSLNGALTAARQDDIRLAPGSIAEPPHHGRVEVVEAYFDNSGRPITRKGLGAARVARRYDEHGHQVEEAYFNVDGKPTVRHDLGAARISWRYDASGQEVEAALFGADGAPVRKRRRRREMESA